MDCRYCRAGVLAGATYCAGCGRKAVGLDLHSKEAEDTMRLIAAAIVAVFILKVFGWSVVVAWWHLLIPA